MTRPGDAILEGVRALAVCNPLAGVAATRSIAALSRPPASWSELSVRLTEGPGHARELARQAVDQGYELVLAVGGDGTANEVAEALLGSGATLGVIPVGSGNGLARALRIPLDPERALVHLAGGVARLMDVGFANDRPFLNVAGGGFDAAVGQDFQAHGASGRRRGVLSYVRLAAKRALSYQAATWTLQTEAGKRHVRAWLVVFANGPQYGGGAVIAPGARLDDGRLDVVIFEEAPRLELLWNAPRLFLGSIEGFRRYTRLPVESAVLSGPGPYHRDGEPEASLDRFAVRVQPQALRVLVPRQTAEDPTGPFLPRSADAAGG